MKYWISLGFQYLSMKMNLEKWIFQWDKLKFEPIGNSVHTAEYLASGKTLLAKLYLKVKVYTNLLSVHNLLCLQNNFARIFFFFTSSEHWINFFSVFVSLRNFLGYNFSLNASIFTTTVDEKKEKNQFYKYFWKTLLKVKEKVLEIHRQRWLSITWILKKIELHKKTEDISEIKLLLVRVSIPSSLQNSYLITRTLRAMKMFYFILIIALSLFRFWLIES